MPTSEHHCDLNAERAVVSKLLENNNLIDDIGQLSEDQFFFQETRHIFSLIVKNLRKNVTVDELTMLSDYKIKLPNSGKFGLSIKRYAEIIENKAVFRSLVQISNVIDSQVASEPKSSVCVDLISSMINDIYDKKIEGNPKKLADTLPGYKEIMEKRISGVIKPIETGFTFLDKNLGGGLEKGTLTVVAGRPGMGKSAFGICTGMHISKTRGVLFLSMEMSETQVNDRVLSILGDVPISFLRNPDDKEDSNVHWNGLIKASAAVEGMQFFIDDQTGLNLPQVYRKLRRVKRSNNIDVMIIDQLSFLTGGESKNHWEITGEYTRGLIQMAKESDIAVILLCQLNRECEKRVNKRPMLSDLASSGSIEQDASNVLFLYRDSVYDEESPQKDIAEVIVAKQRQGSVGTTYLKFNEKFTKFENFAFEYSPPPTKSKGSKGFYDGD